MISLDYQNGWIRSLQLRDEGLISRQERSCCVRVSVEEAESLLRPEDPLVHCSEGFIVPGRAADFHANQVQANPVELVNDGLFTQSVPRAQETLGIIVRSVLPQPNVETGPICTVASPFNPFLRGLKAPSRAVRTLSLIGQSVNRCGFRVRFTSIAQALILAELAGSRLTGVALSTAAGCCSVCVMAKGRVLIEWTMPVRNDWEPDSRSATPRNSTNHQLARFAAQLVADLEQWMDRFADALAVEVKPLPVLARGRILDSSEFLEVWQDIVAISRCRDHLGQLTLVTDCLTPCRGSLVGLCAEQKAGQRERVA